MKMKARIVLRRPWLHHAIFVIYIGAPIVNILLLRIFLHMPLARIIANLGAGYGTLATIWLLTAPLVAIALYFVSRFSWYLFLAHSSLILIDFVLKWATRPAYYLHTVPGSHNILILAGNLGLIILVAYVLQRDFRAPYLHVLHRTWREKKRIPVQLRVSLDEMVLLATDLSPLGCFVREPESPRAAGTKVAVKFHSDTLLIECTGEIMRITKEGVGIRFMHLPFSKKREIGRVLRRRLVLRHKVELPATWKCGQEMQEGRILNLSRGGCYIQAPSICFHEGTHGSVTVLLNGRRQPYEVSGTIVWINSAGGNEEQAGYGLKFDKAQRRLLWIAANRHSQGIIIR
jgi:hypothetical protein